MQHRHTLGNGTSLNSPLINGLQAHLVRRATRQNRYRDCLLLVQLGMLLVMCQAECVLRAADRRHGAPLQSIDIVDWLNLFTYHICDFLSERCSVLWRIHKLIPVHRALRFDFNNGVGRANLGNTERLELWLDTDLEVTAFVITLIFSVFICVNARCSWQFLYGTIDKI